MPSETADPYKCLVEALQHLEDAAKDVAQEAKDNLAILKKQSKVLRKSGIGKSRGCKCTMLGAVGSIAAVGAAPFTGGASLLLLPATGAAAVGGGIVSGGATVYQYAYKSECNKKPGAAAEERFQAARKRYERICKELCAENPASFHEACDALFNNAQVAKALQDLPDQAEPGNLSALNWPSSFAYANCVLATPYIAVGQIANCATAANQTGAQVWVPEIPAFLGPEIAQAAEAAGYTGGMITMVPPEVAYELAGQGVQIISMGTELFVASALPCISMLVAYQGNKQAKKEKKAAFAIANDAIPKVEALLTAFEGFRSFLTAVIAQALM